MHPSYSCSTVVPNDRIGRKKSAVRDGIFITNRWWESFARNFTVTECIEYRVNYVWNNLLPVRLLNIGWKLIFCVSDLFRGCLRISWELKLRISQKKLNISSEINKKVRNRRTKKKKKKSKVGNTLSKQIIPRIRRKILFSQNFLIVSD